MKKHTDKTDTATQSFQSALACLKNHPIFAPFLENVHVLRHEQTHYPQAGYAFAAQTGRVYCHPKIRLSSDEWVHVIAHCFLHFGMGHFVEKPQPKLWNIATDLAVEQFLADLKLGRLPQVTQALPAGASNEIRLYERLVQNGLPDAYVGFGTAGDYVPDMVFDEDKHIHLRWRKPMKIEDWQRVFALGLSEAVRSAVDVAAGLASTLVVDKRGDSKTKTQKAREWFISSYPLLGAIASAFKVIEDIEICRRLEIQIAAVSCSLKELYFNPFAGLSDAEYRFVMAHEFLHAALRHDVRQEWRDAYLWNIACDFVINGWLTEMGIGERPTAALYDVQFKSISAEAVYDRIVTDMRLFRKLATLRGQGLGDILPPQEGGFWGKDGSDLDAFYRRALGEGLSYHEEQGRGYLPEGLVEEIRSLSHPPIPWDVELARWFDEQFTPLEKRRSFARASRRQSATPDIPRPAWVLSQAALDGRTFGVVLDTSGSMERGLLAACLGAIASYSASRDVPAARVVFCDAEAYDQGYMAPADIAGTVKVKGRGGTVLQPGIELLVHAEDFPGTAPILIITDGYCDERLILHGREHAFLIPAGEHLPFVAKGPVFRVR
ncbi:hypothetical protein FACS1894200_08550 [Spirochaetia bacterium]|nr:hypothetical protein FACS1894200_08550 [Spirochaetia bacterium]